MWSRSNRFIGTVYYRGCKLGIVSSLKEIGEYSFSGCTGLERAKIPDGVTSIGDYAFAGCSALATVEIPNSVTDIVAGAFSGCTSLNTVSLPLTGSSLGSVFLECSSLKTIVITSGTDINSATFRGLENVENITISADVTNIDPMAFITCVGLKNITVDEDNPKYYGAGACVIEAESKTLVAGCKNSIIPEDYSVTNIGEFAFSECSGLTSIKIPGNITTIGAGAFMGCEELLNVTIENGVKNIGVSAFAFCFAVTSITIPDSIINIGKNALYVGDNLVYNEYDNALYLGNNTNPYVVLMSANDKHITSCNVNENAKIIYFAAFMDCTELMSITIPDGITSIGYEAFEGCDSLQYNTYNNAIYLGNSTNPYTVLVKAGGNIINSNTKVICYFAFSAVLPEFTSIVIPNSVTSIGESAFESCTGLTEIVFQGTKAEWATIEKGTDWNSNTGDYVVKCTDGDIAKADS